MAKAHILVADIGGTHARFALAEVGQAPSEPSVWLTSMYDSLGAALDDFLSRNHEAEIVAAAFCAAGPVQDGEIRMTNCPWSVKASEISSLLGISTVHLINDFAAVAIAIPHLADEDIRTLGASDTRAGQGPKVALGPGTGLGVAGLVPDGSGGWIPVSGEGGHVDLAPSNNREISIIYQLAQEFGHVSVERVLSGPGLETLYAALSALDGQVRDAKPTAVDIVGAARRGNDPHAKEAIQLFSGWLGAVAGDLALTFGATGGVYIAGGIIPQWGDLFDEKLFRRRFELKGRFNTYLAPMPTYLITAKDVALRGLATIGQKN